MSVRVTGLPCASLFIVAVIFRSVIRDLSLFLSSGVPQLLYFLPHHLDDNTNDCCVHVLRLKDSCETS